MDFREQFIGGLMETWLPCYFVVGNHDIYYKNTLEVNCYNELPFPGESNAWFVYDKPQEITIENQDIAIIPWITSEALRIEDCSPKINLSIPFHNKGSS